MSTRGDLTRLKILDTARALFAEKGYAAVAMEDIRVLCGLPPQKRFSPVL